MASLLSVAQAQAAGWRMVCRVVTFTCAALGPANADFRPAGQKRFLCTGLDHTSGGTHTFGVTSNLETNAAVIEAGIPNAAMFHANRPGPMAFYRLLESNEIWNFAGIDTSNAQNAITFLVYGYQEP